MQAGKTCTFFSVFSFQGAPYQIFLLNREPVLVRAGDCLDVIPWEIWKFFEKVKLPLDRICRVGLELLCVH